MMAGMARIPEALTVAVQHHQAGRLTEAERIYREILAGVPDHPGAWGLLGAIAHQTGQNELAVKYIERAIELNGTIAEFHNNLGEACRALNRLDEAGASYERALQLKPDYVEAQNNLGIVHLSQGAHADAALCFQRAVALNPRYAKAHANLGNVLKETGRLDEAAACYQRALQLKPDFPEALRNLEAVRKVEGNAG